MKLIFAIVRNSDADHVVRKLGREKIFVTRLASQGGFLKQGNTTLMSGVQDDQVDRVIELIKSECGPHQRITVNVPHVTEAGGMMNYAATAPVSVELGGATIFVTDVDRFEKI